MFWGGTSVRCCYRPEQHETSDRLSILAVCPPTLYPCQLVIGNRHFARLQLGQERFQRRHVLQQRSDSAFFSSAESTLAQEIETLWIRLKRLHDVIPTDLDAAPSKSGRTTETHLDEFLRVLKTVWKQQTNSPPDIPRHNGITEEFVGDFLDFAWAAVELARKLPNSKKLRLSQSKNALGERLARKNRTKSR